MVEVCIRRSSRRPGVWIWRIELDGSLQWAGEAPDRANAIAQTCAILADLDAQQPGCPVSVSNL